MAKISNDEDIAKTRAFIKAKIVKGIATVNSSFLRLDLDSYHFLE